MSGPALEIKEKQFQELVIQAARMTGWACYHTHDSRRSEPGYPDLHLVHGVRGESLFAELKTEKGQLSAAQKHWLAILAAAGQRAYVWRPSDWDSIERILVGREVTA